MSLDQALAEAVAVADAVRDALADRPRPLTYSVPQAAKALGTSPDTVRRLIRAGHLPTVPHVGARQLVPVAALEAFVAGTHSTARGDITPPAAESPDRIGAFGEYQR